MTLTKYAGLSYPIHFLIVGVVLLGIIFLNTELIKPLILRDKMIFYALLAINKEKHILNRLFRAPVVA